MAISFVVKEHDRLPQLNTICIAEVTDDALGRSTLLNEYNLENGAGLGGLAGKLWRIGLMAQPTRKENVL